MVNIKTGILSLKNDVIFKAVFGRDTEECKTVLKYLLNTILDRKDDPIVDIEYKNPFNIRESDDDKEAILDIKASTDKKELIDIEMQMFWQEDLRERLIIYHGGLIHESLKKGEPYRDMKKTITVCIMDSEVFHESKQFMNCFFLMEEKEKYIFSDKTKICCIELPKVNCSKRPIAELTPLEICLEYLKHADENGSEYVNELICRGGKELKMVQMLLERATEDEILREKALAREKLKQDIISGMYGSYQKGLFEGGNQKAREIAARMKGSGMAVEEISHMTGLPLDEIENNR